MTEPLTFKGTGVECTDCGRPSFHHPCPADPIPDYEHIRRVGFEVGARHATVERLLAASRSHGVTFGSGPEDVDTGELASDILAALDADPVRLHFGQEVILDCGPTWGGEKSLIVGWVERTESLSVSGQFVSSGASREYVLQDALDAPTEEAVLRAYDEPVTKP